VGGILADRYYMQLVGKYKRGYRIMVFLVLPLCVAVGFSLGIMFAIHVGFIVDLQGIIFVLGIMLAFYVMGVRTVKKQMLKHQRKDKEISGED